MPISFYKQINPYLRKRLILGWMASTLKLGAYEVKAEYDALQPEYCKSFGAEAGMFERMGTAKS